MVSIYTQRTVREDAASRLRDPLLRRFAEGRLRGTVRESVRRGLGSGVIMDPDGYILTNYHVVGSADDIRVKLADGRVAEATLAGSDPDSDLAVLKVDLERLPTATLGSSATLKVGDVVLAIGNTVGIGQTVTMGIVSATGRNELYINPYEDFIQTDAAINQGNSGGALVTADGALIGINTAIVGREIGVQGVGFAIPSDFATNVMAQILENGKVVRGWLGIVPREPPVRANSEGQLGRLPGVIAAGIYTGTPADAAAVQPGDLILRIDGREVNTLRDFFDVEAAITPGTPANLQVRRGSEELTIVVEAIQRPPANR